MSLTTDDIEDIKQLLTANNRVLMSEFNEKFDGLSGKFDNLSGKFDDLSSKFDGLSGKFDDLHEFVSDSITTSNDANGEEIAEVKRRLTKLESSAA